MSVKIGHASQNENKKIRGGKAGDQNGKEVYTRTWYVSRWSTMLRPKNADIAERSAQACEAGCKNDRIGYSQDNRNSLHTEAQKVGYNLSKITEPCETDCSAFMTVCAIAGGVKNLEYSFNAPTTSTMVSAFTRSGCYTAHKDSKYLVTDAYLRRGDILVAEGRHTVMVLSNGSNAEYSAPRILRKGSRGADVKALQSALNATGLYALDVDGDFGSLTEAAVKDYQKRNGLDVDGLVGSYTRKMLGL